MSDPIRQCVIVGFGPGVGLGIAKAFGRAGFRLGLVARTPDKPSDVLSGLAAEGIAATLGFRGMRGMRPP